MIETHQALTGSDQGFLSFEIRVSASTVAQMAGIFLDAARRHRQGAEMLTDDPRDEFVSRADARWLFGVHTRTLRRWEIKEDLPGTVAVPKKLMDDFPAGELLYPSAQFSRCAKRLKELSLKDPDHISRLHLFVALQIPVRVLRAYEESGQLPAARRAKAGRSWLYPREQALQAIRDLGLPGADVEPS